MISLFFACHSFAAEIPIEAFARYAEFENVKISPDGKHLAVSLRREGYLALIVLDRASLAITAQLKFSPPFEIHRFEWAKKDRLIATLAVTLGYLDFALPTGELYGINADGSNARFLIDPNNQEQARVNRNDFFGSFRILSTLPEDPTRILINTFRGNERNRLISEIQILDVTNGRMSKLVSAPRRGSILVTNRSHSEFLAITRTQELSLELHQRRAQDDEWQLIRSLPFESGDLYPIAMEDNGRTWALENVQSDTLRLVTIEPQASPSAGDALRHGVLIERIHDHSIDIDAVLVQGTDRQPYAVRMLKGLPSYQRLNNDSAVARLFDRAAQAFPGHWLEITSITADEQLAIVFVRSDRIAGRFYLLDVNSSTPKFLLDARRWLKAEQMAPTVPFEFLAEDRQTVHGYWTAPKGTPPYPTVVLVHGGPHHIRDEGVFNEEVQLLASRGYGVLQINYRGSGGYGKAFLQAGFGQWGGLMQRDIRDGVLAAIAQGHADKDRICIMGGSFGGYSAAMNPILWPDLYRCAIGLAGLYDVQSIIDSSDVADDRLGLNFLARVIGTDEQAMARISPLHQAERLRVPLLLGHGTLDARVPIANAKDLADRLRQLQRPVRLEEYKGEGHGLFGVENRVSWYQQVLAFLAQHLRP